jgi:hypothetical protein
MEDNSNLAIVQAALGGDPVETERLFTAKMNDIVSQKVDGMRREVAAQILTVEPSSNETGN